MRLNSKLALCLIQHLWWLPSQVFLEVWATKNSWAYLRSSKWLFTRRWCLNSKLLKEFHPSSKTCCISQKSSSKEAKNKENIMGYSNGSWIERAMTFWLKLIASTLRTVSITRVFRRSLWRIWIFQACHPLNLNCTSSIYTSRVRQLRCSWRMKSIFSSFKIRWTFMVLYIAATWKVLKVSI